MHERQAYVGALKPQVLLAGSWCILNNGLPAYTAATPAPLRLWIVLDRELAPDQLSHIINCASFDEAERETVNDNARTIVIEDTVVSDDTYKSSSPYSFVISSLYM